MYIQGSSRTARVTYGQLHPSGQQGVAEVEDEGDDENILYGETVISIYLTFLKVEMTQHCRPTNSHPPLGHVRAKCSDTLHSTMATKGFHGDQ